MTFRLPPDLNAALEEMAKAFSGAKGEFLRYLVRQEWKAFERPSTAPSK